MTMRVSFKISTKGSRPKPKPKPEPLTVGDVDAPEISKNLPVIAITKPPVNVTEDSNDDAEISDAEISFFINLFPDGYSIGNPSENRIGHQATVQDDPKFLHPYDRTSESLFLAIERGLLPADFLDDIPCKFYNGAVVCEVRDYRNCGFEPGVNGSSADMSPVTTKLRLKMSLENVVKDIPLISDSSWTYGDLMEAEARILKALQPKLNLDPTPNIERLCRTPICTKLNLNIRDLRRKRLRMMAVGSENQIQGKKVCMDRIPENSNPGQMMSHQQQSDLVNLTTPQNMGPNPNSMLMSASPSLSYQSKYQLGAGNPMDMMNSYGDNMNPNMSCKRENQDGGQLSPMAGLKRARSNSNPMVIDGGQSQTMDGFNVPDSQWKNSLMQQQGRGIQLPNNNNSNNSGIQKYPQQMFDGGFNQDPFSMRYNLKQEPLDSDKSKYEMPQQFSRSSFPPTPWNNLGNSLDNSRKEESFQRRKTVQSPRGTLPQSPLSSKSGEFSSGGQYGVPPSQREKSAVTSVGPSAQMAASRRSNSLPKTPAMSGVASPASVVSGPFNATSPLVGKEADKIMRDRFSKIETLTLRYQLNNRKNKVDEYKKSTAFPTLQLNRHLFDDHNNADNNNNPKDDPCKMPLSKSLVGGSMNVCKTRVLNFVQTERVLQGSGFSLVPKSRTRLILSEKRDDGSVAMHYGEMDDCDYLGAEECLPTLPNTHFADLLASQFCTLIGREGYHVEGDQLQPKPTHTIRSSNDNTPGEMQQTPESNSGQPSNEPSKQPDNNMSLNNQQQNMTGGRMHPPVNSQSGMLPGVSIPQSRPPSLQSESQQPSFQQQNQHSLMQQQLQRSSAMMLASSPLSHLNAMGQNSNMQQLGHMLNKATPLQLQILQQQQQQQPQMQQQRKLMMGLGNGGMGAGTGNSMVGIQGMGNVMGRGGGTPGAISGMGQNPINMSQASNFSNVISQQLRNGMITPAQAAIMTTKLRMAQSRNISGAGGGGQNSNIAGLPGGNRQVHPGLGGYSMLGPTMNRGGNTMNPMQRTAMAPPKLISGMNVYMNQQQQQQQLHVQQMSQQMQQMPPQQQQQQQQETTSPLQAVLSPPQQQVGSPGMGLQQQASPQQMSQQRTPMSPQLSSGGIHPQMSGGGDGGGNCPASPQLSSHSQSQTMGSVGSMANSPMDMQGVNKSS